MVDPENTLINEKLGYSNSSMKKLDATGGGKCGLEGFGFRGGKLGKRGRTSQICPTLTYPARDHRTSLSQTLCLVKVSCRQCMDEDNDGPKKPKRGDEAKRRGFNILSTCDGIVLDFKDSNF